MEIKPQKVVRLEAQNVMRLKVVEINADGDLIVIGGRNRQGKSSVLNAIAMALGGEREVPAEPIRRGEEDGEVILELNDLRVTRRFEKGRTSKLEVKAKEGYRLGSPQKILDSLIGGLKNLRLTFDPLDFVRAEPKKQFEILKQIVTIDLEGLEDERQRLYNVRTEMNREIKRLEGALQEAPCHDDAPADETSVVDLIKERDQLSKMNQENQATRARFNEQRNRLLNKANELDRAKALVSRLENELAIEAENVQRMEMIVEHLEDHDLSVLDERVSAVEETNRRARENRERDRIEAELEEQVLESKEITTRINTIDEEKRRRIAEAPFPVDGLGFGEEGITFNELPFDQASQAEQLRVAVAIGLAMNPKLRILLIRDGSLLDRDNLALIATMAKEAQAQLWIERVGEGEECSVIIEDGQVKGSHRPSTEGQA